MVTSHLLPVVLIGLLGFANCTSAAGAFRDCPDCPLMVKVPAGTFAMGSSAEESRREGPVADGRPQHSVTIPREFALGQYAVTRGEFAVFVKETGYDAGSKCWRNFEDGRAEERSGRTWRNPGYAQTDRHPVVCVSFEDAQHYVQWLSQKTGQTYRLSTEAEWEYAARAGTTTTRFWGDSRERACEFANVTDFSGAEALNLDKGNQERVFQCRDGFAYTAPVGSFRPNAFGLYDMLGNVWQWTEDCYHSSYNGAPSDGSAWTVGECKRHVLRGGSWLNNTGVVQAAYRFDLGPAVRFIDVGFRVRRTLSQ